MVQAFTGKRSARAAHAFDTAVSFYPGGFELVREAFVGAAQPVDDASDTGDLQSALSRLTIELIWTAAFWGGIVFTLVRVFSPEPVFPSIAGRIDHVRFFEMGESVPAPEQRLYQSTFDSAAVHYVVMEVAFRHDTPRGIESFPVTCWYDLPGGGRSGPELETYRPQVDATGGVILYGWGTRTPGQLQRGTYQAECSLYGRTILKDEFRIQ
jgi:hypothetical protein